jgi:hypothetical protein
MIYNLLYYYNIVDYDNYNYRIIIYINCHISIYK